MQGETATDIQKNKKWIIPVNRVNRHMELANKYLVELTAKPEME